MNTTEQRSTDSAVSAPAAGLALPILAMAVVNIIWGAAFPLTKPALETIPPFTFALLRFAVALAVLLPLAHREAIRLLRGPDARKIAFMGLLGFCLAQVAQTLALQLSPASDISLLSVGSPLWIALLARIWLGEQLGRRGMIGFALAISGLALILWPADYGSTDLSLRIVGDVIFLINGFTWACYNVMGKDLMARHAPLPTTTAAGLVGFICLIPFAAGEWLVGLTPRPTLVGVAAVAYTGLLVTVFGFLVLFWAYSRVRASQVAITMYLQPLAGVLLAWAFLGEPLSALFVAGAALVLAGVALVTAQTKRG